MKKKREHNRFKIVTCPNCKRIQVTESEKRLKCIHCGKSKIFKGADGKHRVMIHRSFDDSRIASKYCRDLKKKFALEKREKV